MKQKYSVPIMEVIEFYRNDVITSSSEHEIVDGTGQWWGE